MHKETASNFKLVMEWDLLVFISRCVCVWEILTISHWNRGVSSCGMCYYWLRPLCLHPKAAFFYCLSITYFLKEEHVLAWPACRLAFSILPLLWTPFLVDDSRGREGHHQFNRINSPGLDFEPCSTSAPDHTELNHELWQVCPLEAKRTHMTLGLI